ncbi:MAG TPA: GGDEF domain-containing protein [Miltoncostaeaceae bacterium]|nr:GGDEF domain-containing protein [Miltoncostaeaceae bacterium]
MLSADVLLRIFDALESGLVVRGEDGTVVAANAAARLLIASAPHLADPGAGDPGEHRMTDAGGGVRWIDERRIPLGRDGVELAVLHDVTRQREGEDQLTQALAEMSSTYVELDLARDEIDRVARTDALTGAANRGHGAEALAAAVAAGPAGVLLLDVDHFKRTNDTHGHAAGDAVLVEVVRRASAAVRRDDLVARWGGEEFLVLVADAPGPDALARLGERVRAGIAEAPVAVGGARIRVTVSVGAAVTGTGTPSADALVAAADDALYAAKDAGRDRVMLAPPLP